MKDFIKKWFGDFLFWSATVTLAYLWFFVGATEYLHRANAPGWFMIGLAMVAAFFWSFFFSSTKIGGWIIDDSGWRLTGMQTAFMIVIIGYNLPLGEGGAWLEAHAPWNVEETMTAAEPEPPPPPQVADTQPTVMRYITGLNEDGKEISLMGEEMYEVRGVEASTGGAGFIDSLWATSGKSWISASECLPQAGISTDWVTLIEARCGGFEVKARCVKRNADACQLPKTTTP
jgi:hypothetical protein